MILHKYLEIVLGSVVKIKILRTMFRFPEKTFTGRELASLIKDVSHMAVANSIKDLEDISLIDRRYHGNSNLFKLNKESYLFSILESLFKSEENTVNELKKQILNKIHDVDMVVLFGSIAKKQEHMDSDIDLLVVTKNKRKIRLQFEEKMFKIIRIFGNVLSVILLNPEEFKRTKNKPCAKDLVNNYVLLKGDDLIKEYWK